MIESNERFDASSRGSWDSKRSKYRYSPSGSDGEKEKRSRSKYKKSSKKYKKKRSDNYSSDCDEYKDKKYGENVGSGGENREHSNNRSSGYSDVEVIDYRSSSRPNKRRGKKKSRHRRNTRSSSRSRRSNSTSSSSSASSSRSSNSSSSRQNSDGENKGYNNKSRSRSHEYRRGSSSPRGRKQDASAYSAERQVTQGGWYPPQGFGGPDQQQNIPSYQSQHMPASYPEGTYPPNYSGQNFGPNYQQYSGYEQSSYYQGQQNFQHQTQQQSHDYSVGGQAIQGSNWNNSVVYPDISHPPPPPVLASTSTAADLPSAHGDKKIEEAKKEAIEQELIQQKRTLAKQREDYVRKKISLNRELSRLKDQKRDLLKENSKENERILRENAKLQNEIQAKLKSIDNVIEMLSNIIGDSADLPEVIKEISKKEVSKKSDKRKRSETPPQPLPPPPLPATKKPAADWYKEQERSTSPAVSEKGKAQMNLVHYDPELHWCSDCDIFPRTVVDYLNHLHSETHKVARSKVKLEEMPWHDNQMREQTPPFVKDAPCKRIPIRGVQFLVPSNAWYCSLCKEWLGDLALASKHLKSNFHTKNYSEFISQNPHWEVDWLTERTRSYERNSEAKTRQREKEIGNAVKNEMSTSNPPQPSPMMNIASSIGDQILAMLAQNPKLVTNATVNPSLVPEKNNESQSSDSSGESQEEKSQVKEKKKKKKSKKKKRSEKSPSKKKPTSPNKFTNIDISKSKDIELFEDMETDFLDENNLKLKKTERTNKPNSSLEYLYNNDFQVSDEPKKDSTSFKNKNDTGNKEIANSFGNRRNYMKGRNFDDNEDDDDDDTNERTKYIGNETAEKTSPPVQRSFYDTKIVLNAGEIEYKEVKKEQQKREIVYPESDKSPTKNTRYKEEEMEEEESEEKNYEASNKDYKYSRSPDTKYHKKDKKREYSSKESKHRDRYESSSKSHRNYDYKEYSKRESKYEKSKEKSSKEKRNREKDDRKEGKSSSRKSPDGRDRKGKKYFVPGRETEDDNSETVFEKRTSESAAKKKDVKKTSFTIPKTKLPFIGRMPILKKKTEQKSEEVVEDKKESTTASEDMKTEEQVPEIYNQIPFVQEYKDESQTMFETDYVVDQVGCEQPLPKSTLIISKRPRLMEPEIVRKEVLFKHKTCDDLLEQDMDIDDDHPKDELHKDFKDALDLLFPENKEKDDEDSQNKDSKEEVSAPPVSYEMMAQNLGYDMSMYTDQTGYQMAYYDQAAYMQHQAYLTSMGYDTSQMPPGYVIDPSAYMQQTQAAGIEVSTAAVAAAPTDATTATESTKSEEETAQEPSSTEVAKKKNPLSQRMRRHLKKKAMEAEKSKSSEDSTAETEDEPSEKNDEVSERKHFIPQDMSDLALLGIEEGDITAQSFF